LGLQACQASLRDYRWYGAVGANHAAPRSGESKHRSSFDYQVGQGEERLRSGEILRLNNLQINAPCVLPSFSRVSWQAGRGSPSRRRCACHRNRTGKCTRASFLTRSYPRHPARPLPSLRWPRQHNKCAPDQVRSHRAKDRRRRDRQPGDRSRAEDEMPAAARTCRVHVGVSPHLAGRLFTDCRPYVKSIKRRDHRAQIGPVCRAYRVKPHADDLRNATVH
jgi:hypothetical protein